MRNNINILFLAITVSLAACGKGEVSKEQQLADLKKQQVEIQTQIAALQKELKAEGKLSEPKATVVPVAVLPISPQTFSHYLEVQGRIDFDQNVGVSAKVPGVLTSVRVQRGDRVTKGQTLATIDASVLEQSLVELKTGLQLARTVYEKQKRLWDQKIGTEIQYLQAKNNKEALESRLAGLQQQHAQFFIKAPISGVVDEFTSKVGEAVSPGMPVAHIVNNTGMKVIAEVPEAYADKVERGDEAIIFLPDLNQEVPAKVSVVSRSINAATRAFPIEVSLKGADAAVIRPNMIAVVKVKDYAKEQAVVVPVNVVQKDETGNFVYVAAKNGNQAVVQKKKVTTGQNYAGKTEITNGLSFNDHVITAGYQSLNEGQPVTF